VAKIRPIWSPFLDLSVLVYFFNCVKGVTTGPFAFFKYFSAARSHISYFLEEPKKLSFFTKMLPYFTKFFAKLSKLKVSKLQSPGYQDVKAGFTGLPQRVSL
jgi:hypothetical protein